MSFKQFFHDLFLSYQFFSILFLVKKPKNPTGSVRKDLKSPTDDEDSDEEDDEEDGEEDIDIGEPEFVPAESPVHASSGKHVQSK